MVRELLARRGGESGGAAAEVPGLGGHQHPHARRNGDHGTVLMARSTIVKVAASLPGGIRMIATPITISITGDPTGQGGAIGTSAHGRAASTITGANAEPL